MKLVTLTPVGDCPIPEDERYEWNLCQVGRWFCNIHKDWFDGSRPNDLIGLKWESIQAIRAYLHTREVPTDSRLTYVVRKFMEIEHWFERKETEV